MVTAEVLGHQELKRMALPRPSVSGAAVGVTPNASRLWKSRVNSGPVQDLSSVARSATLTESLVEYANFTADIRDRSGAVNRHRSLRVYLQVPCDGALRRHFVHLKAQRSGWQFVSYAECDHGVAT